MSADSKINHGGNLNNNSKVEIKVTIIQDGTTLEDNTPVAAGDSLLLPVGTKNVTIKIKMDKNPPTGKEGGSRLTFGEDLIPDKVEFNSNTHRNPKSHYTYVVHLPEIPPNKTHIDANVEHPEGDG